jgi:hypothetical protein
LLLYREINFYWKSILFEDHKRRTLTTLKESFSFITKMSISEAILFVATNSNACKPCLQFVSQQKIPMQIVRLDTESARKSAENGKFFQITVVPTMVIVYEDGNTQLFLGTQKIIQWFKAMIKPPSRPQPEQEHVYRSQPSREENMYGPISSSYPIPTRKPFLDEGEDMEEYRDHSLQRRPPQPRREPIVIEEDYPEEYQEEEEEVIAPPPVVAKKSRTKKGKSKIVVEEGSIAEKKIIAKEKLNKAASAKGKVLSSKMKNVYDTAKQMEEDMKNSLGYKEEELPHY